MMMIINGGWFSLGSPINLHAGGLRAGKLAVMESFRLLSSVNFQVSLRVILNWRLSGKYFDTQTRKLWVSSRIGQNRRVALCVAIRQLLSALDASIQQLGLKLIIGRRMRYTQVSSRLVGGQLLIELIVSVWVVEVTRWKHQQKQTISICSYVAHFSSTLTVYSCRWLLWLLSLCERRVKVQFAFWSLTFCLFCFCFGCCQSEQWNWMLKRMEEVRSEKFVRRKKKSIH